MSLNQSPALRANVAPMPDYVERAIIQHSICDVIGMLENQPVQPDYVGQITAAQLLNRAFLAHLSIERALKFLITQAGGPLIKEHHLGRQLRELARHDRRSTDSLEQAFQAAVRHFRFNQNARDMGHLRTLEANFEQAGSNQAFQDVRDWELNQSLDQVVLRRISIWLHIELLHALHGLLRSRPLTETVASRVERAVDNALSSMWESAAGLPAARPNSIRSYSRWRQDYASSAEALADAFGREFMIGDEFINGMVRKTYRALLASPDPAVDYFAERPASCPDSPGTSSYRWNGLENVTSNEAWSTPLAGSSWVSSSAAGTGSGT